MKRLVYAGVGVVVLVLAGFMISRALSDSLVYFILPSEYAAAPEQYQDRRIRLGGFVAPGSVRFDDQELHLAFEVTDMRDSYPVRHVGTPPDLFEENAGVVVEGRFEDDAFVSDTLLVKHSEVYTAPEDGEPIDVETLKDTLQ